ncbi:UNVERIFIED_CONTAM: hypothetical protein Sradi_1574500 [Sesamum radiatum]|uniref:Uncharacterized protein n=1 Tax=Sesamum radiatum TaxID=300843 RepID=A0AAW2U9C1_SESRA
MANEDDFTFCSVGPPKDNVETRKVDDYVSGIHRDDGNGIADDRSSGSIWKMSTSSQKQETIGSLSFSVIDASPSGEADQWLEQAAHEGAASSAKAPPEQKSSVRKSTPPVKVLFEKGIVRWTGLSSQERTLTWQLPPPISFRHSYLNPPIKEWRGTVGVDSGGECILLFAVALCLLIASS